MIVSHVRDVEMNSPIIFKSRTELEKIKTVHLDVSFRERYLCSSLQSGCANLEGAATEAVVNNEHEQLHTCHLPQLAESLIEI